MGRVLGDLLNQDRRLVGDDTLYRCLDKLLEHKVDLFGFLKDFPWGMK